LYPYQTSKQQSGWKFAIIARAGADSDNKPLSDESTQHLQGVNLREAKTLFCHPVRHVIFEAHEFRTLQSLVQDYKSILSNHGHNSIVKFSYVKEIIIKEFAEDIDLPTAAWKSGINAIRVLSLDRKTSSSRRKVCNLKLAMQVVSSAPRCRPQSPLLFS